jgi:hypothetical protein
MQDMSFRNQGYGYRGEWGHHRPHPAFFILPMLLMGFLFFTALKFLWPVLLVGLVFMFMRKSIMRGGMRHGNWGGRGGWHGGMGQQWGGHGRHFGQGMRGHHGHWGWDSDEEKPKRKNDDDQDDDKPKRDGNTLYV